MYAKQKMTTHSDTGFLENARYDLSMYELNNPNMTPTNIELHDRDKKFITIWIGVAQSIVAFVEVYFITVWNIIIDTASFIIPSPKTIENNFGYFS